MDALESIRNTYNALKAEIDSIDAKAAPLIAKGKEINQQVQFHQAALRTVSNELEQYRGDDYAAKKKLLGQLAVALGGKKLVAETGQV